MRLKGLLSTAASRAWIGVALIGLAVVVLVVALALVPRLAAGQRVLDVAGPAFADERVAGTRAGIDVLSGYVDVVDPLLTARGGASADADALVRLLRTRLDLSREQARRILRREAPRTEALTRALPLAGIADEIPRLTAYLAATLTMTEEQLAATLVQGFPRISQTLTALPNVADAWYDVPGIEGLTRLSRDKPVRTIPGVRKAVRDDVLPLLVEHDENVRRLGAFGGIGYLPWLLLGFGIALLVYGTLQARRAVRTAPGRLSWSLVVGAGIALLLLVAVAMLFARLSGAQQLVADADPLLTQARVAGLVNGLDAVGEAVELGAPIMTAAGGAAREVPRLYRFVAERTGRSRADVRSSLRSRAPRTVALLEAIPLSAVAAELPGLRRYLARALRVRRAEVDALLRERAPRLAEALLALPATTRRWDDVPATAAMTRFDGVTPVRSLPELEAYVRDDVAPALVAARADVDRLAGRWPPLDALAPLLLLVGLVTMLYGGVMAQFVARRY